MADPVAAAPASSFWLFGGELLQRLDDSWSATRADLRIESGVVAEIVPGGSAAPRSAHDIDAGGMLVLPGLINAHLHSNDNLLRGRVERAPLELYMLQAVPVGGLAELLTDDEIQARTLLGAVEAIKTGTTSVLDDCYHLDYVRPEAIEAVLAAYRTVGLRAHVTANLADRAMTDTVPFVREYLPVALIKALSASDGPSPAEALALCSRYAEQAGRSGLVRFAMAASGPQRCTDEYLQAIHATAVAHGVPFVTHVLETRSQALTGEIFYGETLISHMARLGVLSPATVIAHGIWVTDADIDLIGQSGATVVHNPSSNLRLGSGVAPIRSYLSRGVPIALGTDGISTNDAQNMFLEIRLAASLHNIKGLPRESWVSAAEALDMATAGGARALGRSTELGQISVGYRADLALLDRHSTAFTPLSDPARNVAFSEYGQSVHTVIVDGKVVMRDRRLTLVNEDEVYDRAGDAAASFFGRNEAAFGRVAELLPAFERAQRRLDAMPLAIQRWVPGE